jgi:hypothetical protein
LIGVDQKGRPTAKVTRLTQLRQWATPASRSAKPNHCANISLAVSFSQPGDARTSVPLTRLKHLQLGNAIFGAAELPTKLAVDILHHHHAWMSALQRV